MNQFKTLGLRNSFTVAHRMIFSGFKRVLGKAAIIPAVVTLMCLVPFLDKAFHIDDPLFIWSAKQIQVKPADFYGFDVNWYGTMRRMSEVTKNPPLTCYYMALAGMLFGWSEIALHTAFLVPAVLAVMGMYYLARQLCSRPVMAALAGLLTPAFLVSSTNVMCDTMMLAFWVWAIALWIEGIKTNGRLNLFLGAVLIAGCSLTKYFGMSLVVLLFVYSIVQKRRLGVWVLFLLIPVVILAGYQWMTHTLYGRGLLSDAATYSAFIRWKKHGQPLSKLLTGLTFSGGGIIMVLFYTHVLWPRRVIAAVAAGGAAAITFILVAICTPDISRFAVHKSVDMEWGFFIQYSLMALAGGSILALAVADFCRCKDADSLLLMLWMFGTFIFASLVNWTVNIRSVLPIVPATGILLMRQIDRHRTSEEKPGMWGILWPMVPAAIIAISVCWADYTLANSARTAAKAIEEKFGNQSFTVWFQGHWGFQYYMEAGGGVAYNFGQPSSLPGDKVIIPVNNTNVKYFSKEQAKMDENFKFMPCRWLATMSCPLGAGFYTDILGPLPFMAGKVRLEEYRSYVVLEPPKK